MKDYQYNHQKRCSESCRNFDNGLHGIIDSNIINTDASYLDKEKSLHEKKRKKESYQDKVLNKRAELSNYTCKS
ncbi:hypothetical protein H1Q59_02460 [Holosporaceae bacterium 'Namur']|nr:hypothetical protein [Holosporaceae bacterium 'Namur']